MKQSIDPLNDGPFSGSGPALGLIAYFLLIFEWTGRTSFGDIASYLISLR